jgi:hypothetical protein
LPLQLSFLSNFRIFAASKLSLLRVSVLASALLWYTVHKHLVLASPTSKPVHTVKLAPSSTYSSSTSSLLVVKGKAPVTKPKHVAKVTEMCFGGGGKNDTVVIRKYEKQPRHHHHSYVSRPEVSSYRKETVTRRSNSTHRPSYDHQHGRRSGSRIVEERRYY